MRMMRMMRQHNNNTSSKQPKKRRVSLIRVLLLLVITIAIIVSIIQLFGQLASVASTTTEKNKQRKTLLDATTKKSKTKTKSNTKTTHAVIHIGPHKTGTTSIQTISMAEELKLDDGYEMPWTNLPNKSVLYDQKNLFGKYPENQWNFATCFISSSQHSDSSKVTLSEEYTDEKAKHPCVPELLEATSLISKQNKNLFISSENLSLPSLDIKKLSDFLHERFDKVTIVLTYRRYYDILQSLYNEDSKPNIFVDMIPVSRTKNQFLLFHLNSGNKCQSNTQLIYSKYKQHFDNVVVLNYHSDNNTQDNKDSKDIVEKFYCDAIPGEFESTCNALRDLNNQQQKEESTNTNTNSNSNNSPSSSISKQNVAPPNLVYGQLAIRAVEMGMIESSFQSKKEFFEMVRKIRYHHEETLQKSTYDFQMICPSQDLLDRLLNKTIEIEKELFPEFYSYKSKLGEESALKVDFDKQKTTKLCDIDIDATLQSDEWKSFFQSSLINDVKKSK